MIRNFWDSRHFLQTIVTFLLLCQPCQITTSTVSISEKLSITDATSNTPREKLGEPGTQTHQPGGGPFASTGPLAVGNGPLVASSGSAPAGLASKTKTKPYFEDIGPRNVTTVSGQSVVLKCRVRQVGDRTVSWMRKRDLHILTSSIHTYTSDGRFSVLHPEYSDDWDLHIEYVQKLDAGVYECQVNTEPKINMAVMLNIQDAQASIWGSQDVYVKKGSTISLTCSVNIHPVARSATIQWYHDTTIVEFDSQRGGISLETEKTETALTSKLLITNAALADSGNYTCVPANSEPASVFVHVLIGENPAAMQSHSDRSRKINNLLFTITSFSLCLYGFS